MNPWNKTAVEFVLLKFSIKKIPKSPEGAVKYEESFDQREQKMTNKHVKTWSVKQIVVKTEIMIPEILSHTENN